MGQRLVVTIRKDEENICKVYYHWSAYTESALEEVKSLIDGIYDKKHLNKSEFLLHIIRYCESCGGGIKNGVDGDEWKYIQNLYPHEEFSDDINRNYGLIALSKGGMQDLQDWSEGDAMIDLDADKIYFDVVCWYEFKEDYIKERKEWDDDFDEKQLENIKEYHFDITEFPINEIDDILSAVRECDDYYMKSNGCFYEFIA